MACRLVRFDHRNIKQAQFLALRIWIDTGKDRKGASIFSMPGAVSRRYRFQSNDWLVAPVLGLSSARQKDHSGDQLRSMPRLPGNTGSIGARICSRRLPLKSRCQVNNGHKSTRCRYGRFRCFFPSGPQTNKTECASAPVPAGRCEGGCICKAARDRNRSPTCRCAPG